MGAAPGLAIGWAAFHTVWATLLIWAAYRCVEFPFRGARASVRYAAASIALIAAVLIAVLVAAAVFAGPAWSIDRAVRLQNGQYSLQKLPSTRITTWLHPVGACLPYVAAMWAAVTLLLLVRLVQSLRAAARVLRTGRSIDCSGVGRWHQLLDRLAPGRPVTVMETDAVASPATIGWRQPVILLPRGHLSRSTLFNLEAVFAHELAHIGRRDYLFNVIQIVIDSVFYFDLGVGLLGQAVRNRRESCCDELAVAALGADYRLYVKAIYGEAKAAKRGPALRFGDGSLIERFRYLQKHEASTGRAPWALRIVGGIGIAMMGVGAASATAVRHVVAAQVIEPLQQIEFTAAVYGLLGVPARDNGSLLRDVQQAVAELNTHKAITVEMADALADDFERGVQPDALLRACLPSFTAASAVPRSDLGWSGGGKLDWQEIALEVDRIAARSVDRNRQRKLGRAALLLAAQQDLTPGLAYIRQLASDPGCLARTEISDAVAKQLWVVISITANDNLQFFRRVKEWSASDLGSIPADVVNAAQTRPSMQWLICNEIDHLREINPVLYERRRTAVRATGLPLSLRLLP